MIINGQIFINVNGIDKDIRETTYAERFFYYNSISKGKIAGMLEKCLKGVK